MQLATFNISLNDLIGYAVDSAFMKAESTTAIRHTNTTQAIKTCCQPLALFPESGEVVQVDLK